MFWNGKIPTKKGKQRYVTTINNVFNPTFTFLVGILSSSILFGVGPENKLLQKSNYWTKFEYIFQEWPCSSNCDGVYTLDT